MTGGMPFLIIIVIGVIALAVAYFAHQQATQRTNELASLAMRLGWQFDPRDDPDHDERYAHFAVFDKGHSRRAYNTLHGAIEVEDRPWPVQAGDYLYKTTQHNGKHQTTQTHRLSYAIIETPHLGAPDLCVRREGLFDRFASFMGFDDIDFESVEFSERFHVKCSDKRFAFAVLDPRMMEFLLESDPPAIELRLGRCCLVRREKRWSPEEFAAAFDWAQQFFARWPRQVPSVLDSDAGRS